MINIHFYGSKSADKYEDEMVYLKEPWFAKYEEDLGNIKINLEEYKKYPKIILIGREGLTSSFSIYLRALKGNGKKVFILNYADPDIIINLMKEYTPIDTLVICVTNSKFDIVDVESVLQFHNYPVIVITQANNSQIKLVANHYSWKIITQKSIENEYSSFSSSALIPAEIFGLPLDRIVLGAKYIYASCSPLSSPDKNIAWQAASFLYRLGLIGKNGIILSLNSYYLETSFKLIHQLIQSVNNVSQKDCIGVELNNLRDNLTINSNKKNSIGILVSVKQRRCNDIINDFPDDLLNIGFETTKISDINKHSLENRAAEEFDKYRQEFESNKIPYIHLELQKIDSQNIGEFIAFWQYLAYYLSMMQSKNS